MSVNMNFGPQNMNSREQQMYLAKHGHQQVGYIAQEEHVAKLGYDDESGKVHPFKFDKVWIDDSYNIRFGKDFDGLTNKPKGKTESINIHYKVVEEGCEHEVYGDEVCGEIIIREKYAPILTILNVDHIEEDDKHLIDEMLFHITLLTKRLKFDKFFLVLEETGSTEEGEPFTSHICPSKGLFKKTVFSISIEKLVNNDN